MLSMLVVLLLFAPARLKGHAMARLLAGLRLRAKVSALALGIGVAVSAMAAARAYAVPGAAEPVGAVAHRGEWVSPP